MHVIHTNTQFNQTEKLELLPRILMETRTSKLKHEMGKLNTFYKGDGQAKHILYEYEITLILRLHIGILLFSVNSNRLNKSVCGLNAGADVHEEYICLRA